MIEGIIAESEDETLMDRYLGGEELPLADLIHDLETAVARGSFFPGYAHLGRNRSGPSGAHGTADRCPAIAFGTASLPQ